MVFSCGRFEASVTTSGDAASNGAAQAHTSRTIKIRNMVVNQGCGNRSSAVTRNLFRAGAENSFWGNVAIPYTNQSKPHAQAKAGTIAPSERAVEMTGRVRTYRGQQIWRQAAA